MLNFHSLRVVNGIYFKDAKIKLDSGKILVVNGRNLRSREKQQTNGAGKSLLFSYIPNITFAADPISIRSNTKKDLYSNLVNGEATLEFSSNDSRYKIKQHGGINTVGYDIFKDGKNQGIRTTPLSEKYIRSVFPLSEAEFYTTVYLNSLRQFVFQTGKSEARLKFFTEFFRLDYYDQMRVEFQQQLKQVKRVEIEVSTLEGQRLRYVEDLKSLAGEDVGDVSEVQEKFDLLKDKRSKIAKRLDSLTSKKSYAELLSQLLENIDGAKKPSAKRSTLVAEKIEKLEKQNNLKSRISQLRDDLESVEASLVESKSAIKTLTKRSRLTLEELRDFKEDEGLILDFRESGSKLARLVEDLEELDSKVSELEGLVEPKTSETEKFLTEKIEENRTQIRAYKKLKEHIEEDTCPTCGATIDIETLKNLATAASKNIAKLESKLRHRKLSAEIATYAVDAKTVKVAKAKHEKIAASYDVYAKKKKVYQEFKTWYTEYQSAVKNESALSAKILELESKLDDSLNVKELDSLRKELANNAALTKLFKQLESIQDECKEAGIDYESLNLEEINQDLKKYKKLSAKVEGDMEELRNRISRHQMHKEKEKLLSKKLAELSEKIEQQNVIVADKVFLENLIKVYSNKGIKIQKVNGICRILERNLNHFKSLVFDENFKFKINIEENVFDVLVDRGDGMVSDVRRLSGSEGRRFNLLLLISLLPLTPPNRRSNLVILDEMESNASPTSMRLFCDRYLPELHKMVPNIVVITPLDLRVEGAQKVLITKDKDGSRVDLIKEMVG